MTTIIDKQDINVGGITIHWTFGNPVLEYHEIGDDQPEATAPAEESAERLLAWMRRSQPLLLSTDLEHMRWLYDEFMRCTDRIEKLIHYVRSQPLRRDSSNRYVIGWDFPRACLEGFLRRQILVLLSQAKSDQTQAARLSSAARAAVSHAPTRPWSHISDHFRDAEIRRLQHEAAKCYARARTRIAQAREGE